MDYLPNSIKAAVAAVILATTAASAGTVKLELDTAAAQANSGFAFLQFSLLEPTNVTWSITSGPSANTLLNHGLTGAAPQRLNVPRGTASSLLLQNISVGAAYNNLLFGVKEAAIVSVTFSSEKFTISSLSNDFWTRVGGSTGGGGGASTGTSPVPLPASAALLLGGLSGFGFLRRRQS